LKISVASPNDSFNDCKPANPSSASADTISSGDTAWWKFGQSSGSIQSQQKLEDETVPSESSTGTMINLMAVDAFQVSELCALIHDMFPILPVQLIGATCLLYYLLGRSAIICFILLLVLIPLNVAFAGILAEAYERIMKASDARIKLTSEILENIKVIKVRVIVPIQFT
jgi:ABC-type multidrug transport system fused ATPase/permease subunit